MEKQETQNIQSSANSESVLQELTVRDIIGILWSKAVFIILAAIIGGALTYSYLRLFVTPKYSSTITMFVYSNPEAANSETQKAVANSELTAAETLANSYKVAMKSERVLNIIKEDLKERYNYEITTTQINKMTTVSLISGTALINLQAISTDKVLACDVANSFYRNMKQINDLLKIGVLSEIDEARVASNPVSPKKFQLSVIGAIVAGLLISAFFVIKTLSDTTIYSEREISKTTRLPIIGNVPEITVSSSSRTEPWIVEEGGTISLD